MSDVHIKIMDHGPLVVTGPVELVDAAGNHFQDQERYALCRCGASRNKPFCDGTHARVGFQDAVRAQESE